MASEPSSHQGYLTESGRRFLANVPEEFKCASCRSLLKDPHQCKNGDVFCKRCLNDSPDLRNTCPCCEVSLQNLSRCIALSAIINKLDVTCNACTWVGPLEIFERHCETDCMFVSVSCSNRDHGCDAEVLRKDLAEHELGCPHAVVSCELCSVSSSRGELNHHKATVCPQMEVDCPQGCGVIVLRQNLEAHIDSDCSETVVGCPFAALGCVRSVGLRRKDSATHQVAAMLEHLALLPAHIAQLKEENKKPMKQIRSKMLTWKTKVPNVQNEDDVHCSEVVEVGGYKIWFLIFAECDEGESEHGEGKSDEENSEEYIIISTYVSGPPELFPVSLEGTTLSVGGIVVGTFTEGDVLEFDKGDIEWEWECAKVMTYDAARALAVDDEITVSISLRLTQPEQQEVSQELYSRY